MPVYARTKDLPSLTVMEALAFGSEYLSRRGRVGSIEAELLVRHILKMSRADLYSDPYRLLTAEQASVLAEMLDRRKADEPLQYIIGSAAFRDLELQVGPGVLVPRPETEILVARALDSVAALSHPLIFDVGTGSGAVAISIGRERPDARVMAVDVSPDALGWARRNVVALGIQNVDLVEGDLFSAFPQELQGSADLVVANPPYLSRSELERAEADVRLHEPEIAVLSGPTGLELPGRVIDEAGLWLRPKAFLMMEISPNQAKKLEEMMRNAWSEVEVFPDLSGKPRILQGQRP